MAQIMSTGLGAAIAALALALSAPSAQADGRGPHQFKEPDRHGHGHGHDIRPEDRTIVSCRTLRRPGAYVLARNLFARGDCLKIAADLVTVDLAGFTIAGNGTGAGIGDGDGGRFGAEIRNGGVTGFAVGIDLRGTTASRVSGMRVLLNGPGSAFDCDDGLGIASAAAGIVAGSGSDVSGNVVRGNVGTGIHVGSGSRVAKNVVFGNGAADGAPTETVVAGICAQSGSTVAGNVLRSNAGGLALHAGSGSVVHDNAARSNGAGPQVNSGSTVRGNTARGNDLTGLRVRCPSVVVGNAADGNGGDGDLVLVGDGCAAADNVPTASGGAL